MWLLTPAFAWTYNVTGVHAPLPEIAHAELARLVADRIGRNDVRWRDPTTGVEAPLGTGKDGTHPVALLEAPVLGAIWMALDGALDVGAEHDLVLGEGRGARPVTVWMEAQDRLVVSSGPLVPADPEGPPTADLVKRYGLVGSEERGARFEPAVRGLIDLAFERLTPGERAALADVTLVRETGSGRADGAWVHTAEFRAQTERGEMAFFDALLRADGLFIGPVRAPVHPAVASVLHEVGHAVDNAPKRALTRDLNARITRYNQSVDEVNAEATALMALAGEWVPAGRRAAHDRAVRDLEEVQRSLGGLRRAVETYRPVSAGFRARFGDVTTYGATSDAEAFAEAFALFHLDRDALARVSPDAVAWFAGDGHLAGFVEAGLLHGTPVIGR